MAAVTAADPSARAGAGERVEMSRAEERTAICYALGCIDRPGVPLRFLENLKRELSDQIARTGDVIRMWEPATPTERQELDRFRRGWGPSSPTERMKRREDVLTAWRALSSAMTTLSVSEEDAESGKVPSEAMDYLDEACAQVSKVYDALNVVRQQIEDDPVEWPDIRAAEERGAASASRPPAAGGAAPEGETFASIAPERIVSRAAEEMDELRAEPTMTDPSRATPAAPTGGAGRIDLDPHGIWDLDPNAPKPWRTTEELLRCSLPVVASYFVPGNGPQVIDSIRRTHSKPLMPPLQLQLRQWLEAAVAQLRSERTSPQPTPDPASHRTVAPDLGGSSGGTGAPAAGGVAGVATVEEPGLRVALEMIEAHKGSAKRKRLSAKRQMRGADLDETRAEERGEAIACDMLAAAILARLAEPRAGAGKPPRDADAPTFSPRLEVALLAHGEALDAMGAGLSDDIGTPTVQQIVDTATAAERALRRAIRAEIDAAPGRVDAGAVRGDRW